MSDTRRHSRDTRTATKSSTEIRSLYNRAVARGETLKEVENALARNGYHNAADEVFEMWENTFYEAREQFDAFMGAEKVERRAMHDPEPGGSK